MPESPLVQIETNSLNDLEALIADRAKGESETETGVRPPEGSGGEGVPGGVAAARRQVQGRRRVAEGRVRAEAPGGGRRPSSATPRRARTNTPRPRSRSTTSSRRISAGPRRPRKRPAGRRWRSSKGTRDEGVKWRRATEANWSHAIQDLHVNQETAEFLLKRCGRLAVATPEEAAKLLAECEARPPAASRRQPRSTPRRPRRKPPRPRGRAEDNPLTRLRADLTRIERGAASPSTR